MYSENDNNSKEMDFEQMMKQRIQENFNVNVAGESKDEVIDERLKEMNKKLPSWSLEPPYNS